MAQLIRRRVTAQIEGDFVVFLIGMRINRFWKVWKWLPVFRAMPRILRELEQRPEAGLLAARTYLGSPRRPMLVQYWRSFEQLEAYARSRDAEHWPAWSPSTRASAPTATWVSGTRPTSSPPGPTTASTTTCRRSASVSDEAGPGHRPQGNRGRPGGDSRGELSGGAPTEGIEV